jgi:hypothetical protein
VETSLTWRAVLRQIIFQLSQENLTYKIVGGANLALQGLSVPVKDVDIETTAADAYRFQSLFPAHVVKSVSLCKNEYYRSHFGRFNFDGLIVEVMGDLYRHQGEQWLPTTTLTCQIIDLDGIPVNVSWLEEECLAYIRRGRLDRAALILPACNQSRLLALLRGEQSTNVI